MHTEMRCRHSFSAWTGFFFQHQECLAVGHTTYMHDLNEQDTEKKSTKTSSLGCTSNDYMKSSATLLGERMRGSPNYAPTLVPTYIT